MSYRVYIGSTLLPITPSKININIQNKNETIDLINQTEVNIIKNAGLTDIDFSILLPNNEYPFANYDDGYRPAEYYLNIIKELKTSLQPFRFIIIRKLNNRDLFETNFSVTIEDYKITEDASNGIDILVNIKLKQYKPYGTKTCNIIQTPKTVRLGNIKTPTTNTGHIGIGSNVIVNGRLYRDSYGNGGGKTLSNYNGIIHLINDKGSHPYHITTSSGGWLGWVTRDSVRGV